MSDDDMTAEDVFREIGLHRVHGGPFDFLHSSGKQPPSLADFLLARIAEDQAAAPEVHTESCRLFIVGRDEGWCDCGYPARALAECEAEREMVEDLRDELANQHDPEPTTMQLAERMLLALALPYADHEDYREEWKP